MAKKNLRCLLFSKVEDMDGWMDGWMTERGEKYEFTELIVKQMYVILMRYITYVMSTE